MTRLAIIALLLSGCTTARTAGPADSIRIDHVIIGVADLEAGIAELERITGVPSVIGGVHPGRGTRNALMSLGEGTYLEILAPDPIQAVDNQEFRQLRAFARPTPIGWAVSADDEAALRSLFARAGIAASAPEPGSRAKPDGSTLRWVTFGYEDIANPLAPFFIIWESPELHPSRTAPVGCTLTRLQILSGDVDALARAVAPLQLGVSVGPGSDEEMRLSLSCPKGVVTL